MTTRLGFIFALGVAMGLALSVTPAHAGNRPSETPMFQLLNGERTRSTQADGGGLTLYTADAGIASVTVTGGSVILVENPGSNACHLCSAPADGTWDGGCNTTVGDVNYGSPITSSGGQRWIILRPDATTLKAVPASGSTTCTLPVFIMQ